MKPVSRKQQIRDLLQKEKRALSIEELTSFLKIPQEKVRQSLTTFDTDIVRVGYKLFDLSNRVFQGKMFRYTPTPREYECNVMIADEDINLFLTGWKNCWKTIILIDEQNHEYRLNRFQSTKKVPYCHYSSTGKLFERLHLEHGDDLIFTCRDLTTNTFLVKKEKRIERNILEIDIRNKRLCDLVYDILLHAYSHYESSLFLVRKYLFIYQYFSDPPPDNLRRVISADSRFVITPKDNVFSWSGMPMRGNEMVVGLKKYYLVTEKKEYIPVNIMSDDEFGGKVAYCCGCNERLIWEKDSGWRHTVDDAEWVDAYVPKEFFIKEKTITQIH